MEYQQTWGPERVARWGEAIQRRGGELEPGYCARVTHVLCETQKHGVVMQVLLLLVTGSFMVTEST